MGHTLLCVLSLFLLNPLLCYGHAIVSNKAVITQRPSWSQIISGEVITLTCEIQDGADTEWEYEWRSNSSETRPYSQHWVFTASASSHGNYKCRGKKKMDPYTSTAWSHPITLTVSPHKPKAQLSADDTVIPAGGSVTLTCSVKPSPGWKYHWYRGDTSSEVLTGQDAVSHSPGQISVSQEGLYWCRGGRGDPVYYTEYSDSVRIDTAVPNSVTVTLQPNWPQMFRGENITVRCEIQGGDTEWDGNYRCQGRMKNIKYKTTEWSNFINLTVSDNQPKPVLTVSPSWLSPGASVTLNCEVEHPSAGWRFYWYKAVPKLSGDSYSYELLPGSSSGTEQDSYMVHGQTHTAGYVCRAGRGDPVFYTQYSELKLVWSADVDPAASLTVSPDRVQHFTSDSVSLSCEGNSTEWRVRRFPEDRSLSCPSKGRMTGSTCKISTSQSSAAVYWCESGSGEFSNSVNITFQNDIILLSPVLPVTEGDPVSLSCKLTTENLPFNVEFYKNDKLVQSDTRLELNISAVSKSDEGFYKCKVMKESAQSWVSVKLSRPGVSSFLVPLITGLVCGLFLIILLMLLFCYKKLKDSCCNRPSQDSATQQKVNQDEIEDYSSLLHDDFCLYETIRVSANTGHAQPTDESSNMTSSVQAGGLDESRGCDDTEENSDYYNVNPAAASGP
ncbi:Fc receptor-like protein 5 isoform X2 [Mastacembelus armatus]|uniref:Fc receptor-like protein 5 isoform X2 n=1 Tax=Mastacembelus armatus TaxID=205130 RepID=UPI000E45DF9C|nr:Fc receptor-like protein 5 isoform X2 [Mastacembelus armatus]